jgi:hypothetical protein
MSCPSADWNRKTKPRSRSEKDQFGNGISDLRPDPEIRESSSFSSSCPSSIYWAGPRKEPIFLAIILFRLCDGEITILSRTTSTRTRTTSLFRLNPRGIPDVDQD